jgi:outer membrane protein assembly factor BamD (BamD/ComL family)
VVAPVPIAKSVSAVASSAPPSDDVAGEIALLQDAQLALNEGRYARAIELYDRHAATYPFGAMAQERRAGLALALCGSKRSDALEVAQRFLASNPSPPLAARVRTACHLGE